MTGTTRAFIRSNLETMVEDWESLSDEAIKVYLQNLITLS
jgi:hypothetical protein